MIAISKSTFLNIPRPAPKYQYQKIIISIVILGFRLTSTRSKHQNRLLNPVLRLLHQPTVLIHIPTDPGVNSEVLQVLVHFRLVSCDAEDLFLAEKLVFLVYFYEPF